MFKFSLVSVCFTKYPSHPSIHGTHFPYMCSHRAVRLPVDAHELPALQAHGLPSASRPSDHLPLAAVFTFPNQSSATRGEMSPPFAWVWLKWMNSFAESWVARTSLPKLCLFKIIAEQCWCSCSILILLSIRLCVVLFFSMSSLQLWPPQPPHNI